MLTEVVAFLPKNSFEQIGVLWLFLEIQLEYTWMQISLLNGKNQFNGQTSTNNSGLEQIFHISYKEAVSHIYTSSIFDVAVIK